MSVNTLLHYFHGRARDGGGRLFPQVLALTFDELESTHDFIQWLFPLDTHSFFHPEAPVINSESIAALKADPLVQRNFIRGFDLMLAFYGLDYLGGEVRKSGNFEERAQWLTPRNHNFLRITRILQSLMLLGFEKEARAFLVCLEAIAKEYPTVVGSSLDYWKSVVRPLT